MLSAIFISGGINALRNPQGHVQVARPVLDAVGPAVDKATEVAPIKQRPDDEMLVKAEAGVKIVAGTMLALGKWPRLAATALAASLVPTTAAGHRFWEETDAQVKAQQQIHFFKNVSLLGGLLIAAADTGGKPSLGWRGRRAAKLAATAVGGQSAALGGTASELSGKLSGTAAELSGKASGAKSSASGKVGGVAAGLVGLAPAAARAKGSSDDWAKRADKARKKAGKRSAKLQKSADKRSAHLQKRAAERGAALQAAAEKKWTDTARKGPELRGHAAKLGHDVAGRAAAVRAEVTHQAEGMAKDARKRVAALTG